MRIVLTVKINKNKEAKEEKKKIKTGKDRTYQYQLKSDQNKISSKSLWIRPPHSPVHPEAMSIKIWGKCTKCALLKRFRKKLTTNRQGPSYGVSHPWLFFWRRLRVGLQPKCSGFDSREKQTSHGIFLERTVHSYTPTYTVS